MTVAHESAVEEQGPAETGATIVLRDVSRWYGNVVAVNGMSFSVSPGITGLLGPNGAGKSTVLHMLAGFLKPSAGEVIVLGEPAWRHPALYRHLGLVPERESVYGSLTGYEFVRLNARLQGLAAPDEAVRSAIRQVDLEDAAGRPHRRLLEGDEAAHQGRGCPGARPVGAAARRAVQRCRPAAASPARPSCSTCLPPRGGRSSSPRTSSRRSSGWQSACSWSSAAGSPPRATFARSAG